MKTFFLNNNKYKVGQLVVYKKGHRLLKDRPDTGVIIEIAEFKKFMIDGTALPYYKVFFSFDSRVVYLFEKELELFNQNDSHTP